MGIKIRTIFGIIVGLIIMILGIWNIYEQSSFWMSMRCTILGGVIILISLFFEPNEEGKNGKQRNVPKGNQTFS